MQKIVVSQGNMEILAFPLKKISSERSDESELIAKDIKNIQVQNNYTPIVLQSMCSQLNRIETNSNSEASSSKNINKGKITVSSLFKSHEAVPQLGSLNTKANVLKKTSYSVIQIIIL